MNKIQVESTEDRTYKAIGITVNAKGITKVRWGNDLIARTKICLKKGCVEVDFHELPEPMNKLDSLNWMLKNVDLNEDEFEIAFFKKTEKRHAKRKRDAKAEEELAKVSMNQDVNVVVKK